MAAAQRAGSARPMRADARRNSELLVRTAREVFAEKGVEAPLDEIARRAGVGPGTLYRHFPNREALIEAVYMDKIRMLTDRADELLADHPPEQAMLMWLREYVQWISHQHGLASSLKAALQPDSDAMARSRELVVDASATLLAAGRAAGTVRADIEPVDLMRLGHGLAVASEYGDADDGERMLTVLVAGLRPTTDPATT